MILRCYYCALPDKTTATYVEVLEAMKITVKPLGISELSPYLPQVILTDFEMAIQNAFLHCYPNLAI